MNPSIFFPAPPYAEIEQIIRSQYEIWRLDKEAHAPKFELENIRFEHDPEWRTRIMSIQCAHDLNHPVWQVAYAVHMVAPIAWTLLLL